jgi:hypothetical protein
MSKYPLNFSKNSISTRPAQKKEAPPKPPKKSRVTKAAEPKPRNIRFVKITGHKPLEDSQFGLDYLVVLQNHYGATEKQWASAFQDKLNKAESTSFKNLVNLYTRYLILEYLLDFCLQNKFLIIYQ